MKTTLLSILILTLISCDASTKEFIGTSWKVTELQNEGSSVAVTNDVILTIKSDTDFSLKLDVNNCFGTYAITGKNTIQLKNLGCTEMCCDSDFSMAVTRALYKISTIKFEKDIVTLSGNDILIKFKKYDPLVEKKEAMKTPEKYTKKEKIPTEETTNVGMFENPIATENPGGNKLSNSESITLYKSPCKGNCEEYTMILYKDGTVVYNGKFNAEIQGQKVLQLDKSETEALFVSFEKEDFKGFADKYDNERIMDLQNTYLTYKGKKIHIRDKYSAPKELRALLKKVEEKAEEILNKIKKK